MIVDEGWRRIVEGGRLAGISVRYMRETGSTNDAAIAMAKEGFPTYTVVVAESQTEGRGRLGRDWQSPVGTGLYFSIILRPELPFQDLPKITLVAGLAVALAIEEITKLSPMLKWPNDLLLEDRKLGGILAETVNVEGEPTVVVLGIGLNVNSPLSAFSAELRNKATSLLIGAGRKYRRSDFLTTIVSELKKQVRRFEKSGFKGILRDWRKRDATYGRQLNWLNQKGVVVKGVSLGPDDNGQLLIRDKEGEIQEVLSGDLSLAL